MNVVLRHAVVLLMLVPGLAAAAQPLERIKLPPGFAIEVYANVRGARSLALGPAGVVFVGTMREGKVYALVPGAQGTEVLTLASGLNTPQRRSFPRRRALCRRDQPHPAL